VTEHTKERPMLFSAPMIRALLSGSKTQTRRAVKGRALEWLLSGFIPEFIADPKNDLCPYGKPGDQIWVKETFFAYGLWEKRFSAEKGRDEWHFVDMTAARDRAYQYAASNPDLPLAKRRGPTPGWWKRPAIFMPRSASRILLEVVSVRVELLNDISEADAQAEGCNPAQELAYRSTCSSRPTKPCAKRQINFRPACAPPTTANPPTSNPHNEDHAP